MGVSKLKARIGTRMWEKGNDQLLQDPIREAIEDFKRSENLDQNPVAVYDGLGCCYHALRDYEEAIDYFNKAISAKENNIDFLKNRAQCYFDM